MKQLAWTHNLEKLERMDIKLTQVRWVPLPRVRLDRLGELQPHLPYQDHILDWYTWVMHLGKMLIAEVFSRCGYKVAKGAGSCLRADIER
jgi:hypothetical protein